MQAVRCVNIIELGNAFPLLLLAPAHPPSRASYRVGKRMLFAHT
jgi:hypothetical protein